MPRRSHWKRWLKSHFAIGEAVQELTDVQKISILNQVK
jgi:hypothetical protein